MFCSETLLEASFENTFWGNSSNVTWCGLCLAQNGNLNKHNVHTHSGRNLSNVTCVGQNLLKFVLIADYTNICSRLANSDSDSEILIRHLNHTIQQNVIKNNTNRRKHVGGLPLRLCY